MSDKKAKIQLHSDSQIPKDLLVPTLGSNYGMDGFEDMEYGMGVLEGVLDHEFHQPPALVYYRLGNQGSRTAIAAHLTRRIYVYHQHAHPRIQNRSFR